MKEKAALAQAFDYYDAVVKSDINRADGVSKNPERVKRLMRSFARNQGGQVPNTSIRDDIMANDAKGVNEYTVASYIAALKKIFVIEDLLNDLNTMGLMFETMCVRDLRVYAEYLDGEVMHYRDKSGLECDTVIHLRNGSYGLAEIKLGGQKLIEEGAANLKALAAKIDTTRMPAPSFMMIVVGVGDFAYRREDGIFIVPVGCLKF